MVYLRCAIVLVVFTVYDVSFANEFRIFGVAPQILVGVAVASGLSGGRDRGAMFGFAAGLCLDLYQSTPFGLSAFAFAIAAYLVGFGAGRVADDPISSRAGFVGAGTMVALVVFFVSAYSLGQRALTDLPFWRIVLIEVIVNSIGGIAFVPLTRWMWDLGWLDRDRPLSVS